MSRYVVGDIHGCYDKLIHVLNFINFNPKLDVLYSVGDFCDRGTQNIEVLKYLMNLGNNFKAVFGNHDIWLWQQLNDKGFITSEVYDCWNYNGGRTTIKSLQSLDREEGKKIFDYLDKLPYRIELDDYTIQHTTIKNCEPPIIPEEIDPTKLGIHQCLVEGYCSPDYDYWFWDREVIYSSKEIFKDNRSDNIEYKRTEKPLIIGHTPLVFRDKDPVPYYDKDLNIIAIDTGSFINKKEFGKEYLKEGCITVLNLDNLDYYTSDGRRGSLK